MGGRVLPKAPLWPLWKGSAPFGWTRPSGADERVMLLSESQIFAGAFFAFAAIPGSYFAKNLSNCRFTVIDSPAPLLVPTLTPVFSRTTLDLSLLPYNGS